MYANSDSIAMSPIRSAMFILRASMLMGGLALLGYQAVQWFEHGLWPQISFGQVWLSNGGPYPSAAPPDLAAAILWVFRQPVAAVVLVPGLLLAALHLFLIGRTEQDEARRHQALPRSAVPIKRR